MPRFRDENDFSDRELVVSGGRSFSNDELFGSPPVTRAANKLVVYGLEARPGQRFDSSGLSAADTVPSPKDDEFDGSFVNIRRPDDSRRTFVRSSNRWPSTVWGNSARVVTNNAWLPVFANPSEVLPCIERKVRREVLFAKRRAGGAGSRSRKRRNYWSTVGC